MLETILNQINSNLERVANALERRNNSLEIQDEHSKKLEQNIQENVNEMPKVGLQVQQEVNRQSVIQNQPNAIPTAQIQESFTQEQLAVAMSNAVSAGKMNIIQNILQQFGVQALTQINPSDYNRVATMLKEAGVEI